MKTASKILSMLLLVAMCLSLMGGSAYALAPLEGEGTSSGETTGSGTVSNGGGVFGMSDSGYNTPSTSNDQSSGSGSSSGTGSGNGNVFNILSEMDAPVLFASPSEPWYVPTKDKGYDSLSEAANAANSGETIYLGNNISLGATTTITKSVNIDLGGNTLTIDKSLIITGSGVTVNIYNGTISNSSELAAVSNGATLIISGVTADEPDFTVDGSSKVQIKGGCDFDSQVDDKYMADGYYSDAYGVTTAAVARIGNRYFGTAKEAINAAQDGETVTFITDTTITAAALDASGMNITKRITLELGGNSLNMAGTSINNTNVTINGTSITGTLTTNNANVTFGSGLIAGDVNVNGGSLTINGGSVGNIVLNAGTINMGSGTINKIHVTGTGTNTLSISGGTVEEFVTDGTMSMAAAITGGQWKVADGHKLAFDAALADGYVADKGSTYYTVHKNGETGGQTGTEGNVKYALYGSPYTHGSLGSVYIDLSELPPSNIGFYINTIRSTTGAQQISSSNYTVTNNSYSGYNYRVSFTSNYLNSLANGTYYIITQFSGKNASTVVGTLVVQGSNNILPGNASVWPVDDVWYSGDGMCYFYVTPALKLIDGIQYDYYDVAIDGMQIGGDKLSYNGYQKFGVASSVMDTLAPGNHTITVTTTAGSVSGTFRVGATLRAVDTDKHVIGSSKNLQFICSGTISRVWVGNSELSNVWNNYYSLSNSGKTITLTADFLNNLTAGNTYTLTVMTTSGDTPSCTFQILTKAQASASPQTGDESNLALWAAVLILSGGAVVAVLPQVKKMRSK